MVLFSIICPIYNAENFLVGTVTSVISQTYNNWELVLINDGSTDNSGSICDLFSKKDKRIKVIHQKNQGQSIARLIGLGRCNGKYILFLDSDDFLVSTALEELSKQLQDNKTDVVMFNANKRRVHTESKIYVLGERRVITDKKLIFNECFLERTAGYLWTYCFKKDILCFSKEVLRRFGEIKYSEDVYLIYQVINHNVKSLLILPEPLYVYTVNECSITHNQTVSKVRDRFNVFNDVYKDLFASYNLKPNKSIRANIGWTYLSFLNRAAKEFCFEKFKEIAKEVRSSYIFKHLSRFKKDKYNSLVHFLFKIRMYKKVYLIIRKH